jgi:hypothetical protein
VRLALLALALSAGCTLADDAPPPTETPRAAEYRSESVDAGLDALLRSAQTRGFSPEDATYRGFVVEGAASSVEVTLASGSCYALLAAGSEGLREVQLSLFHGDGTEAAQDEARGRAAALVFCPVHTGVHYAAVRASAGSGLFGLRVARGPTGLDVAAADLLPAEDPR